jgi:hypothetical protein
VSNLQDALASLAIELLALVCNIDRAAVLRDVAADLGKRPIGRFIPPVRPTQA